MTTATFQKWQTHQRVRTDETCHACLRVADSPEVDLIFLAEDALVFASEIRDTQKLLWTRNVYSVQNNSLFVLFSGCKHCFILSSGQCFCPSRCRPGCHNRPLPLNSETLDDCGWRSLMNALRNTHNIIHITTHIYITIIITIIIIIESFIRLSVKQ